MSKQTPNKQPAKVKAPEVAATPIKEQKKEVAKSAKKEEVKVEVKKVETKEVRSESESSSSESVISVKDKLIRQISESISNYSLEKAYEKAGVETPKKQSPPASPLALSSSSLSIHASPKKA